MSSRSEIELTSDKEVRLEVFRGGDFLAEQSFSVVHVSGNSIHMEYPKQSRCGSLISDERACG